MIIDSHTHIYLPEFDEDLETIMERAQTAGIEAFLLPNIDSKSIERVKNLHKKYPEKCYPMMGLHPCSVTKNYSTELAEIEKELRQGNYVAVGEIGIDLYWEQSFLKEQVEAFSIQIEWARELDLPIVIHVREAFQEVFEVMDKLNDEKLRGVFHCFTGTKEEAEKILSFGGFYLGIGGVITFKNAGLDKVISEISIENLIVETDAPYLAPAPYRGKRNEPAYIMKVIEKLSDIYQLPQEEIMNITRTNTRKLFPLS